MKLIKLTVLILIIIFVGFVGWMNLTPGHFQENLGACVCKKVTYSNVVEQSGKIAIAACNPPLCPTSTINLDGLKLFLAIFDFNK